LNQSLILTQFPTNISSFRNYHNWIVIEHTIKDFLLKFTITYAINCNIAITIKLIGELGFHLSHYNQSSRKEAEVVVVPVGRRRPTTGRHGGGDGLRRRSGAVGRRPEQSNEGDEKLAWVPAEENRRQC